MSYKESKLGDKARPPPPTYSTDYSLSMLHLILMRKPDCLSKKNLKIQKV